MKKCQLNEFVLTVAAQAAESVSMKRDFDYSGARRPPTLLVCLHPVSSTCHVPTTMHRPPTDDGENIRSSCGCFTQVQVVSGISLVRVSLCLTILLLWAVSVLAIIRGEERGTAGSYFARYERGSSK